MLVPDFNSTTRILSSNTTQDDCLAVAINPGRGGVFSESRNLSFAFKVSKLEPKMTTVKLMFTTPADVSTQLTHDQVEITFVHSHCFTSKYGMQVNQSTILTHKLPR